jgi:multiple sugar transport system ATP-binding protein
LATVELKDVKKSFGDTPVIKGVSLSIADREFVVFVGPSGCGKSTLLRLVAGLEEMDSGELLIDGARANEVPPAKRGLAMVFQSYALYPHMSVADNMAFSLRLAGVSREERGRKVQEAAHVLQLEPLLARKPKELSGGQRQRVAIARAMAGQPKLVLADEPTANLDSVTAGKILDLVEELNGKTDCTFIFATHDPALMARAQRCVRMHDGVIVPSDQTGAPLLEARAS